MKIQSGLLLIPAFLAHTASAVVSVPVTVTAGFNTDVIAETSPATGSTGGGFNASDTVVWVRDSFSGFTNGVPDNGSLASNSGSSYQLADFGGLNALVMRQDVGGTLSFGGVSTDRVGLLFSATGGEINVTVTLNYSTGAPQILSPATVEDWYSTAGTRVALNQSAVNRTTNGVVNSAGATSMHDLEFMVDDSRLLTSISFTHDGLAAEALTVYAVSVPEPGTYALFLGLIALGGIVVRRRRSGGSATIVNQ